MKLTIAERLVEKGIVKTTSAQKWVDPGAGKGLFTNALAGHLGAGSMIYEVDKDQGALPRLVFCR